jgi:hypothetical protein
VDIGVVIKQASMKDGDVPSTRNHSYLREAVQFVSLS